MTHLVGYPGAFDYTTGQDALAPGIRFAAKGLVEPSATHISSTIDGKQDTDAGLAFKGKPRVDVDDHSDDGGQDPFFEFQDRFALGNLLVTSRKMEKQIDRFADSEPLEHRGPRRTDPRNELDWRIEFESVGQIPWLRWLESRLRSPFGLGIKKGNLFSERCILTQKCVFSAVLVWLSVSPNRR
jgi:hypothetical protein